MKQSKEIWDLVTLYNTAGRQISPCVLEKLSRTIPNSAGQKRGLSGKIGGPGRDSCINIYRAEALPCPGPLWIMIESRVWFLWKSDELFEMFNGRKRIHVTATSKIDALDSTVSPMRCWFACLLYHRAWGVRADNTGTFTHAVRLRSVYRKVFPPR
jgi:hypothetical protein